MLDFVLLGLEFRRLECQLAISIIGERSPAHLFHAVTSVSRGPVPGFALAPRCLAAHSSLALLIREHYFTFAESLLVQSLVSSFLLEDVIFPYNSEAWMAHLLELGHTFCWELACGKIFILGRERTLSKRWNGTVTAAEPYEFFDAHLDVMCL